MRKYAHRVAGITDEQFPLFASAITGRDYGVITTSVVSTRSEKEKQVVSGAMGEGMLQQLVQLLGQVPRIILLILKTNDLSKLTNSASFKIIELIHSSPELGRKSRDSGWSSP